MCTRRWLSLLLTISLLTTLLPTPMWAANSSESMLQQGAEVSSAESFVLALAPPTFNGMTAAQIIMAHARYYAGVQAQLDVLQTNGAIASYTALPKSYAFQVWGVTQTGAQTLGGVGKLIAAPEVSAAAVDALADSYSRTLDSAVQQAIAAGDESRNDKMTPISPPASMPVNPSLSSVDVGMDIAIVTPQISVHLYGYGVVGNGFTNDTPITVTVKSNTGVVKGVAYGTVQFGSFAVSVEDIYSNWVTILPGDIVEVQTPALITVPVVNLTALADPVTNQVTGVGPTNITNIDPSTLPLLEVTVYGAQYVTTDSAGAFVANAVGDFRQGDTGVITYRNPDGHAVTLSFGAPAVAARGWLNTGYESEYLVSGQTLYGYLPVTIVLKRSGAPLVTNFTLADAGGAFAVHLTDVYGNLVPILPGDVIEASAGGVTTAVTVPVFSASSDPATDQVSGATDAIVVTDTVDAPQSLAVWPTSRWVWGYGKQVIPASGAFTAGNPFYPYADSSQFPQTLDWGPGQQGFLRYRDAEGDGVFYTFRAPTEKPVVEVRGSGGSYQAENYVSGYVSNFCGTGMVTLKDGAGAVKSQNMNVYACNSFGSSFQDIYGNPLPILAGDQVEATFNGQTTTVVVPTFTANSNPDTETVSGVTNATVVTTTFGGKQSLAVYPITLWGYGVFTNVLTSGSGEFAANFSGVVDITHGSEGHLFYTDDAGNGIYSKFQAPSNKPLVYLRGDGSGYRAENYIQVQWASYSNEAVRLVIKNASGAVRFDKTYFAYGWLSGNLVDDFGQPVNIQAGDIVEVTIAGQTTSILAPTFDVVSDAEKNEVRGVFSGATVVTDTYGMTQTLAVWPVGLSDSGNYGRYVLPVSNVFTATNPFCWGADLSSWCATIDWSGGDIGHLRYVDANANRVYGRFAAMTAQPLLTIYKGTAMVSGILPNTNAPATVTVRSGATVRGVARITTAVNGEFMATVFDSSGAPVIIEAGNEVAVEASPATTVVVPTLNMTVDAANDTVTGTGPASVLLEVIVNSQPLSILTDSSGAWTADFRGRTDIRTGNTVRVIYQTAARHHIILQQVVGPQLNALLNTNYVWGYAPQANASVLVTVKSGVTVKGVGIDTASAQGFFAAFPIDVTGAPVRLMPGDTVEIDFGGGVIKSLTIANLTLAVNATTNQLSGSGPASQPIGISVGSYSKTVITDGAGQWSDDPSTMGVDIQPGDQVESRYTTNASDFTWLYGVAPVVYVRGYDSNTAAGVNYVSGYATSLAQVTVVLKRGGITIATTQTQAGWDGNYEVSLYDAFGTTVEIRAGDVVEVTASPTVTLTIPTLNAIVDHTTRIVSGVGPANAKISVSVSGSSLAKTVQTDSSGAFSVSFADSSYPIYSVALRYREPGGNWIHATTQSQNSGVFYLHARWNSSVSEYAANAVSGRANVSYQTVWLTLKRGGAVLTTASVFTGYDGSFTAHFRDATGADLPILAGDIIELSSGAVVAAAMIASLTVDPVTVQTNLDADTLFGTGPAGQQLTVQGDCGGNTTIDAAGAWVVECSGLNKGDTGYLYVSNTTGGRTYLSWSTPKVWVRELGNYVGGVVGLNQPVVVQLQRGGSVIATMTTTGNANNGGFNINFISTGGRPVIIQPNDVVVVSVGTAHASDAAVGEIITVPVTPLTAQANVTADTVTGVGPAADTLQVWVEGNRREAATAANGSFTANFVGLLDLRPGDDVSVSYFNADDNEVYLYFRTPLIRINLSSDIVDGYTTPLATASFVLKRGASTLATATATAASNGFFTVFFTDNTGALVDIQAGDTVEVTASPTVTGAAINLTATLDTAADRVTGTGPANTLLLVRAFTCTEANGCTEIRMSVNTDASGAYVADFSTMVNLDATSYAFVIASDAQSNQTTVATSPTQSVALEKAEEGIRNASAQLLGSKTGTANEGDVTPPLVVRSQGGTLIFQAWNGELVVTTPSGSIADDVGSYLLVNHAETGLWKVQVRVYDFNGNSVAGIQYGVATGDLRYGLYLPITLR